MLITWEPMHQENTMLAQPQYAHEAFCEKSNSDFSMTTFIASSLIQLDKYQTRYDIYVILITHTTDHHVCCFTDE